MRKGIWSAAAVLVLLSVGIVVPEVRAADTRVEMGPSSDPLAFAPDNITVPVGSSVEWFNNTDLEHDVQAEDGSFGTPGSAYLGKGGKYEFRFSKAGTFKYFCTPHKSSGMVGTVTVSAGSGATTPTTAAPTTTTAAPGATTTTAAGGASTTTTTAKAAAGESTTTTTPGGATTTTLAPSTTPTSASDAGGGATTTTSAPEAHSEGGAESAAGDHGSSDHPKTNGVGVALAGVLTVILAAISIKLLTAKG